MRANLSVLENIAIVPQYRENLPYAEAAERAWSWLARLGRTECALRRDPDLDSEERFIAKLLRAIAGKPALILIDRPAYLLPDCPYPVFLEATLGALDDLIVQCWIVDYTWNAPLYTPH